MGADRAKFWEIVAFIGAALLVAFVVRTNLFTVIRVDGQSMRETYQDGDLLLVTLPDLRLGGPRQGDVVILHYPGQRGLFVKRVVALGGQVVNIERGQLSIDGRRTENPPAAVMDQCSFGPLRVPQGFVFVLGDNRPSSADSRTLGCIDQSLLVGRVRLKWSMT